MVLLTPWIESVDLLTQWTELAEVLGKTLIGKGDDRQTKSNGGGPNPYNVINLNNFSQNYGSQKS